MDIIRKYSKTHHLQNQNYATVWKKKIAQLEEPASLKMFYTTLEYAVTMKHINWNCIKESAKLLLKNVTQIRKNLSMRKRTRTILNYLLNTGRWQIRNFTHGYPGVQKATINHTTPIQKDVVCVCTKNEIGNSRWFWRNIIKQTLSSDLPVSPSK